MASAPEIIRGGTWPWLRRHWQIPVAVVMLAFAYLTLRGHLPTARSIQTALKSANVDWIVVAAACEVVSLALRTSAAGAERTAVRAGAGDSPWNDDRRDRVRSR